AAMDRAASAKWNKDVYRDPRVVPKERPAYLLIAGDFDQVSVELQQVVQNTALVGRVHVGDAQGRADLAGYAAYAAKVCASEAKAAVDDAPDALFYTAR